MYMSGVSVVSFILLFLILTTGLAERSVLVQLDTVSVFYKYVFLYVPRLFEHDKVIKRK